MNDDILSGLFKQLRGKMKQAWGVLTDDDLDQIDGKRDALVGKLQERYGWTKSDAEARLDRFLRDNERDHDHQ